LQKLICFVLEIENNMAKMIQAIAEDAFGFAPMLFNRDWFELMQPLPDENCPAQG
jgi:hypothetical protein